MINLVNDDMEGTEGVLESDGSDEEGDEDTEGVDIVQDQERDIKAITNKISTGLVDPVMVQFMKDQKLAALVGYVQDQTELLEDNEDEHLDEKEQQQAEQEMVLEEQQEQQRQAEYHRLRRLAQQEALAQQQALAPTKADLASEMETGAREGI